MQLMYKKCQFSNDFIHFVLFFFLIQWKGSEFSPPGLHQQEQKFPNFDSTTAWRDRRYVRDRYLISNVQCPCQVVCGNRSPWIVSKRRKFQTKTPLNFKMDRVSDVTEDLREPFVFGAFARSTNWATGRLSARLFTQYLWTWCIHSR